MDRRLEQIPALFPEPWGGAVAALLRERGSEVEELRFRVGYAPTWVTARRERPLPVRDGQAADGPALLEEIVMRAAGRSVYAVQEQLRAGFLTLPGGHRLGVCGAAVMDDRAVKTLRAFQALNLRLASERPGCADGICAYLRNEPGSLLLLGPPGVGKTTLLRDLVRQLSNRLHRRVGLVDERGELAACRGGVPQLSVGALTDVLTGCPKAVGVELLVRTMNPDWVAVDEITAESDVKALTRASYSGVQFLATAHAAGVEDLPRRQVYRSLLEAGVFSNVAVIRPDRSISCERMKAWTN